MELGLVGLGKMGGNMRERMRRAGHTVVGYDRNPEVSDVDSLEDMVEQLPAPAGGVGDGPGRRHHPADHRRARPSCSAPGDVVVDGGNSRWTDDEEHAEHARRRASASSTAASPAASGAWRTATR